MDNKPKMPESIAGKRPATEMTLRDYFAGQALVGFLAGNNLSSLPPINHADMARGAYAMSDAMLSERAK